MKYGFVAFYSDEVVKFASKAGFDALEIFVDPETSLNLDKLTESDIDRVNANFKENNIEVATISCSAKHLHGDPAKRKEHIDYMTKAIKTAKKFGTDMVVTNAFGDKTKSPVDNLPCYKKVFSEYARLAEDEGITIAIENCPHWNGLPPTAVENIAFSPEMWEAMFNEVPSKAIGLEFDPSHLHWSGIDIIKALRDFGDRVYAFHAKDTEILEEERNKYGIIGMQIGKVNKWDAGWWRYRIPGFGQINWKQIYNTLYELEYKGPMIIEHEDPVFGGDHAENGIDFGERTKLGLKLGLEFLKECDIIRGIKND